MIDPGQAFGTGAHHTTRLCLELLLELEPGGRWPTGAAAAACWRSRRPGSAGTRSWRATGRSPRSRRRGRTPPSTACRGSRSSGWTCAATEGPWAPVVVANLIRPLLLDVAGLMTRPPRTLIVSGLLREEADEVAAAFARHGLREAARRDGGEWSALRLDG